MDTNIQTPGAKASASNNPAAQEMEVIMKKYGPTVTPEFEKMIRASSERHRKTLEKLAK